MRLALLLLVVAVARAHAAPLDDARLVRKTGCEARPGSSAPLSPDTKLDAAARAWAGGATLGAALKGAGFNSRATVSLRSPAGPAARPLVTALRQRFCAELTDPRYTRLGSTADRQYTWVLLAVPSQPPRPAQEAALAREALVLVNRARSQGRRCGSRQFGPAAALTLAPQLSSAARNHAVEMAARITLSHEGRNGSTPGDRVTAAGYRWRQVGENVSAGPETADEAVAGWLASPEHCNNIMDADFTQMGLGFGVNPDSEQIVYWSQVFGRPR